MECIPCEILFNILSRLSVNFVLRLSCTSKFWGKLVRDVDFRRFHSDSVQLQPMGQPNPLILTCRNLKENIISLNNMRLLSDRIHVSDDAIGHLMISRPHVFAGTCNGLLCFTPCNDKDSIVVCNPVTGELVTLPKGSIYARTESCTTIVGIGFHPSTREYKVVRVCYSSNLHAYENFQVMAEVCTLDSNPSWRKLKDSKYLPQNKPAVSAGGSLYWLIHKPQLFHPVYIIVSFDVADEKFMVLKHPDFGLKVCLTELGGHLAAVDFSSEGLMEVWVLNGNWEMDYIIPVQVPHGLDKAFLRLVCMWLKDGVLFTWLQDELFSYESRTKKRRLLKISGFPSYLDWEICTYIASMVPLKKSCIDDGEQKMKDVFPSFIRDADLYSESVCSMVCEQKAVGRHDGIVVCFSKHGMLQD